MAPHSPQFPLVAKAGPFYYGGVTYPDIPVTPEEEAAWLEREALLKAQANAKS